MHPAQLTFPQRPAITAAACPRQLAMVYDQSPTDLAFALLPVFATLWSEQVSADGTEMLPAAAMEELMARVVAAVIITKDQLLNLAAELLPPGRMRELLRYLSQLVGYEEWQQIKHSRRRHLIDISISYLSRARLGQGNLLVEAISRHLFDLTTKRGRLTLLHTLADILMKVTAPNTWERSKRPALATSRRIASSIRHLANGRSWQTDLSRDQRGQPRAWMA